MKSKTSTMYAGIMHSENLAKFKKLFLIAFIASSLLFSIVPINTVHASTTFSIEDKRLDTDGVNSITPKIVVDGTNVYVIWLEGADIFFDRSTDGGTTFAGPVNLSASSGVTALDQHKISVVGANIYVVWTQDGITNSDIFVRSSTDSGATFGVPVDISGSVAVTSSLPQIVSVGSNAYVVWREGFDIYFSRTIDSGANFDVETDLGDTGFANYPHIAAVGTNVYAVWADSNGIILSRSIDSGITFSAPTSIGTAGFIGDEVPKIVASGTDVFVIWKENFNVSFVKSSDSGVSFDTKINLDSDAGVPSADHKIAVSGSNIYVVWQDDGTPTTGDVAFRQSTDGGATFDAQLDLSQTPGVLSSLPDIAAGSVFVTWREDTVLTPNDKDIQFLSSDTDGSNFGGIQFVTSNGIHSSDPQIAASGSDVYVVWSDSTNGVSADGEIKFSKGSVTATTIIFDSGAYKLTDTAIITVTDGASNTDPALQEVISVNVTSDVDSAGILITATENGTNSSDFIGTITFSTGASAGTTLQASAVPPQIKITASFNGVSGGSTITPRSIAFSASGYDLGSMASITVIDQNSNLDANLTESIVVDLSSQATGDAENIKLVETGENSGVFGGSNVELIFSEGDNRLPTLATVTITIEDKRFNLTSMAIDTAWANVTSSSDPKGINFTLTETGNNTSIFTEQLILTSGHSVAPTGRIHVEEGDFMTVVASPFRLNALIVPNLNESRELLDVLINSTYNELVTASYGGVSDVATISSSGGAPGGGGGGVIRPGLVFDVLAGTSLFGGSSSTAKPSISSTSLTIDSGVAFSQQGEGLEAGGILSEKKLDDKSSTQVVKKGTPMVLKFDLSENKGIDNIVHLALYILDKGEKWNAISSTYISYDKYDGVKINDPNGILDDATIDILKTAATTGIGKISLTFNEAVGTKDFYINLWDQQRNSNEWKLADAINVVESTGIVSLDPTTSPQKETESKLTGINDEQLLTKDKEADKTIKPWIKTTAKWWVSDQVSDPEFLMAIEYLIDEEVIEVSYSEMISDNTAAHVPTWFRNVAGWWGDGQFSDEEFRKGLQWLIENGVIKV